MFSTIQRIHQAASQGTHPKLDEQVILLNQPLQDLLYAATTDGAWHFLDVPCESVVGLLNPQRGAPLRPYDWREAAMCLLGEGWGQGAIDYLEGPLRCLPMPEAPGARYALKLSSFGGAVICTNGVHRLAAGLAWHLRPGSTGIFRLAATSVRGERAGRIEAILELAEHGAIEAACVHATAHAEYIAQRTGAQCEVVVRARAKRGDAVLAFPIDGSPAIRVRTPGWMERHFPRQDAQTLDVSWALVPQPLLDAWKRGGWVTSSTKNAEYIGATEPVGDMLARR